MTSDLVKVERALISVSDKSGITDFASALCDLNPHVTILSSGGTYKHLKPESEKRGYRLVEVAEYTGFPESPGGLLKTLHPRVHGAHLLDPNIEAHATYMNENGIVPTDLVVVNLYPFQKKVEEGAPIEAVRENIDIGGPTMIRSAAKNFLRVAVITDPVQYTEVLRELRETGGSTRLLTRIALAARAFNATMDYDRNIDRFFKEHAPQEIADHYLKGIPMVAAAPKPEKDCGLPRHNSLMAEAALHPPPHTQPPADGKNLDAFSRAENETGCDISTKPG